MKFHLVIAAGVVAVLAMPLSAQAQGIIRDGEDRGSYSTTSSGRASSAGESERPCAFAVLRLITSSYLVGA